MDPTAPIGFSPYASESPWLRDRNRMQAEQVGAQMGAAPPPPAQQAPEAVPQPPQDRVSFSPEAMQQVQPPGNDMTAFVSMLREVYSERVGDKDRQPASEAEGMKLPKNVQAPVESIEVMRPLQSWDQPKNRLEGGQGQQPTLGAAPDDRTDFSPEAAAIQQPRPVAAPASSSPAPSMAIAPQRGISPGEIFGGGRAAA